MGTTPKALKDLLILLQTHFDESQVQVSTGPGEAQFLHVQQKQCQQNKGLNLTYLPTFHIIGTLDAGDKLSLKLMTFHGKIVTSCGGEDPLSVQETLDFFKLLDNAHLCCGIRSSKTPKNSFRISHDKYLIEQFEEQVILRSRDCRFAVDSFDVTCEACLSAKTTLEETNFDELPMESSYHSIFGSDKLETSFQGLLDQYSPLVPHYYAAIAAASNGQLEESLPQELCDATVEDEAVEQPAVTLQPLPKSQEPVKDETFHKTIEDIASLGLKSDPFVCGQCEATFKTYFGLRKHVTTSGHESEYHPRCFICLKYFKRAVNLRMHYTSTHLNLRPYKCSQCDFTSATSSSIILHSKSAHNIAAENIMTIDSEIRKLEEFEKRFGIVCMQNRKRKSLKTIHIPEEEYSSENGVDTTQMVVEPEVSISAVPAVDTQTTSAATASATPEDDLDISDLDPTQVCSDPFVCDVCDITAPTLLQMKKHVELTGHETKYYPRCFICLKSFKRLSNLRFHHSSTHLKLRPYKCCHCDYIGTAPSAVINHAKSLHNAQDDEYITIESEMSKLEAFEAKFGIIAMQKRKRKHDKTIPEMPTNAKVGKQAETLPPQQPPMPKLTPAPNIRRPTEESIAESMDESNPLTGYFNNVLFQEYLSNLKRMQNVSLTLLQKALINNAEANHQEPAKKRFQPYTPRGGSYTPRRHNQVDFDVDSCDAQNMNSDPFQCDECSDTFSKPHLLRSHLEQTNHKSRTDAKCFVCQKRCSRLSNLRSHYSAVHFNLKPYKCSLCEVTASNSSTILTHAKDVHNLETNRFITLESEILKLEEYERKFGIVCMQKRKRRTMQASE